MPSRGPDLTDRLRVLVVGCGPMGRRHARVVGADPRCALLLHDRVAGVAESVAAQSGGRAVDAVPREVDVAIVATPTTSHAEVAGTLLARGVWCLVEKPLAPTSAEAAALAAHPRCLGAMSERYNRAVRALGACDPVRLECHRHLDRRASAADDVVLDLMVHDLDLVARWKPATEITSLRAEGTSIDAPVASALAWLTLSDGSTASLAASRGVRSPLRWARLSEPARTSALDLLAGRAWRGSAELARPADDALTAQWEAALGCVLHAAPRPEAGVRAVAWACLVRDEIRRGSR